MLISEKENGVKIRTERSKMLLFFRYFSILWINKYEVILDKSKNIFCVTFLCNKMVEFKNTMIYYFTRPRPNLGVHKGFFSLDILVIYNLWDVPIRVGKASTAIYTPP